MESLYSKTFVIFTFFTVFCISYGSAQIGTPSEEENTLFKKTTLVQASMVTPTHSRKVTPNADVPEVDSQSSSSRTAKELEILRKRMRVLERLRTIAISNGLPTGKYDAQIQDVGAELGKK